ncbi:MAG: ABC transporter ATP-binding protein [Gemmatimonadetes bacterium]|nr:ABC transporter ATP-binding protein [Gemmatimonadota bacterium]
MTAVLSVRDLGVTFDTPRGPARAVDGVSFDLHAGETLALVGESGCGKTVTALSILRLLPDAARVAPGASITYAGADILKLEAEPLRQVRGAGIAMVFQEPMTSLNPVLSVGWQIAETVLAHKSVGRATADARAIEVMKLVGIADAEDRYRAYPHQLSGGLCQRVMIAMALACEPKVLIADEPTTALDVTIQAQILELLVDLKRRLGLSVLLISHDLALVSGVADRIAVMYGGHIVEEAATADVFAKPVHPYTEGLLGAVPRIDRPELRLAAIPGNVPPATEWPAGCRFHPRCAHAWDRCSTGEPGLVAAGANRTARCWLIEEPGRRKSS